MSRRITIVTPENIEVSYLLAGIGSRFIAALVDHLLQILVLLVVLLVAWLLDSTIVKTLFGGARLYVWALAILVLFAVIFGYFTLFELLWAGQTPGKRLVGLRVLRDGGYPVDVYSSAVRNLVRIVDFLPPAYGIGLLAIFLTRDYKRLGDVAAGTLVVQERTGTPLSGRERGPASPQVAQMMPFVTTPYLVTPEEFQLLHRFVQRRPELDLAIQAHLAMRLAPPFIEKMGIQAPIQTQLQYADLLEAIERRYVEDRGVLDGNVLPTTPPGPTLAPNSATGQPPDSSGFVI